MAPPDRLRIWPEFKITASGQADPVAVATTSTCTSSTSTCPPGVSTLDVALDFISPPETGGFSSGGSATSQLAVLNWNQFLLYPEGTSDRSAEYQATLKVPAGWRYGTALPIDTRIGQRDLVQARVR